MTELLPWVKWRFDRWRADEGLRMCGLAARGLWADLLAIMHGCKPYGHLSINGRSPSAKQIAGMVGMTSEREVKSLLSELEANGVFSRTDDGLVFCRRMVRDNQAREKGRANGLKGGNPALIQETDEPDNHQPYEDGLTPEDNTPLYDRERERKREREENPPLSPPLAGGRPARRLIEPDWRPSAAGVAFAVERGIDAEAQVARFVNHHAAKGSLMADWGAAWRVWISNEVKWAGKGAKPVNPNAAAERAALVSRWLERLREHFGDEVNGTTVGLLDRVSKQVPGNEFTRWLSGIEAGDRWVLERIAAAKEAAA